MSKLEAVRQACERLGPASPQELAAFVEANFGLTLKPAGVTILLAALREREYLEQGKRRALAAAGAPGEEGKPMRG